MVFLSVPSAVAYIQASQESDLLIDQDYFFMVAPKKRDDKIVRMPYYFYVCSSQFLEISFYKLRVIVYSYLGFLIQNDVYLDPSLG